VDFLGRFSGPMKILLTGSTGFVGRHLDSLLRDHLHEVFPLVRGPIQDSKEIIWDFKGALPQEIPDFDILIHLAAKADFNPAADWEIYQANTLATARLAQLARIRKAFFIFASTAGVHGNSSLITEDSPIRPLGPYAVSKYLAEELVALALKEYFILRIGGIYGLDGPLHLTLNRTLTDAYHRKAEVCLRGSGQARRNYICVQDVARWIATLVKEREAGICRREKILYLAGPQTLTINDYLASVARTLSGSRELVVEDVLTEAKDCVIKATPVELTLTTFEEYLISLKQKRDKNAREA